ncbi:MAG: thiolase family protein [Bdellovibrionales bacterium]|nr:thiolase family protein [Bdellovibrionales bacterium]
MNTVHIYGYGRSAIGKFGGSLQALEPGELGARVATGVMERLGSSAKDHIGEVIVGNVLGAGHGMNLARQVCLKAGLAVSVPAYAVNKVCGSGLKAVGLGYQAVTLGEQQAVLCGGVENMSLAAHVLLGSRFGTRLGAPEIRDLLLHDGLTDAFEGCHMGITAENLAKEYSISREEQDDFAFESQQKAVKAIQSGQFSKEIIPVEVPGPKRTVVSFAQDEHPRLDLDREGLSSLRPAFDKAGTVTAGNASGINDGAAFVVLGSEKAQETFGCKPRFTIRGVSSVGVEPRIMGIGPVFAVQSLLAKTETKISDIDVFELNEAFASQSLAVLKGLELDESRVNPRGGAIALGHPIGASGARILVTLLSYMEDHGLKRGVASLCVGGGQGIAILVESND